MRRILLISFSIFGAVLVHAQNTKEQLLNDLSKILEKGSSYTWTGGDMTQTVLKQTLSNNTITQVIKKNGYLMDTKVDASYTYVYSFSWDSLLKVSVTPPEGAFSLSGCNDSYCYYQLNFPQKVLQATENGKSKYSSGWFMVYIRKEDKEKYFMTLQKLYQLLHPVKK